MKTQKKQRCFIYVNFKSWKSHCVFIFLKTFYPLVPNMEICHKHFLDKIFTKQSLCKVWEERARTSNSIIFLLHLDPSSYRVLNIIVCFIFFNSAIMGWSLFLFWWLKVVFIIIVEYTISFGLLQTISLLLYV